MRRKRTEEEKKQGMKEAQKRYKEKHKEEINEYLKNWQKANKEKVYGYTLKYYGDSAPTINRTYPVFVSASGMSQAFIITSGDAGSATV